MKSQRSLLMQRHLRSGFDDFCRTIMAKKTARKCSVRFELLFAYLNCSSFDLLVFVVVVDCAELASSVITQNNSLYTTILPEKTDEIDVRWHPYSGT